MMRGGHLDATILGAFQGFRERRHRQLGHRRAADAVPGIGGAMDLVAGARKVIVVMEHTTRDGRPKLLRACTFPLTGKGAVDVIYTDMAVIDVDPARGFVARRWPTA